MGVVFRCADSALIAVVKNMSNPFMMLFPGGQVASVRESREQEHQSIGSSLRRIFLITSSSECTGTTTHTSLLTLLTVLRAQPVLLARVLATSFAWSSSLVARTSQGGQGVSTFKTMTR